MLKAHNHHLHLKKNIPIDYKVYFTEKTFSCSPKNQLFRECQNKKVLAVIDHNVEALYGSKIIKFFSNQNIDHKVIINNANENEKSISSAIEICKVARNFGIKRDSLFIAIGGGITMDTVGLAAALYRRKISYIRIPTTLVGLIDAGVGIKVGVNLDQSKNLLGHYYAPHSVFADQSFLTTLALTEIRCGLYEMIKMAMVRSANLFSLIEENYLDYLQKNFGEKTQKINYLSIQLMMEELEPNLHEHILKRLVDFGHTFSPHIETSTNYSISHGEAVGLDILISTHIAFQRKILNINDFNRIVNLFKAIGFSDKTLIEFQSLHNSLNDIKNHRAGNLNLVLPINIGSAIFTNQCSKIELKNALAFLSLESFV